MGKQTDKRIELARRVLDTTDKTTLDAIEIALLGPAPTVFTKRELEEMETLADRVEKGLDPGHEWSKVKRGLLRRGRK